MDEFCLWAFNNNIIQKQYSCHLCSGSVCINFTRTKEKSDQNERNSNQSTYYECILNRRHKRSIFFKSIFHNSNIRLSNILLLMYGFVYRYKYSDLQRETFSNKEISSATISRYFKLFKELIFALVEDIKNEVGMLGGKGSIIEVDECLIGNRKYNRGRFKMSQWIIGIVERNSGNVRFEPITSRNKYTLLEILKKYVNPESTIITDCWKGYVGLNNYFLRHQTVNHSKNFKDPITGAYTQTIESHWRILRQNISLNHKDIKKREENLTLSLCEYIYRHHYRYIDKRLFGVKFITDICLKFNEFSM